MKYTQLHYKAHLWTALTVIFTALTFASSASAAKEFQGRVQMTMQQGKEKQKVEYFIKSEKMRLVPEMAAAQGGVMIMNMKKKEMYMIMPAQKMYMVMPIPDLSDQKTEQAAPEPQDETREILGYKAQKYLLTQGPSEYEIWATKELGKLGALQMPGQKPGTPEPAWAKEDFFPLEIIERRNGQVATQIQVTEVEAQELPDSLFEPPADFRRMAMPTMPNMPSMR